MSRFKTFSFDESKYQRDEVLEREVPVGWYLVKWETSNSLTSYHTITCMAPLGMPVAR